jgi:hypothetical protein
MNTVGNTANMMAQAKMKAAQAQKAQREGQTAKAKAQSELQAKNQEVKNLAPKMMPAMSQNKLNMMG